MSSSALTWLDGNSASRRRALEVIKLFEERGTIDEIGIGSIRDAFADILFPGTSVLQPRARYFILVPAVYRHIENSRTASEVVAKEARRLELSLIEPLLESDDSAGTIGRAARSTLKVLPSSVYWSGLGVWGIRLYPGSQEQYHRSLDGFYRRLDSGGRDDDGQPLEGAGPRNWHSGLPALPRGFPKCPLSLRLTRAEAAYLKERIVTRCPRTLLAYLVDVCRPAEDVPFVWEHAESDGFPEHNRQQLIHACNFSEVIHGAALLYNLLLAERAAGLWSGPNDKTGEKVEDYRSKWARWGQMLVGREAALKDWSRSDFWSLVMQGNPRVPRPTRVFVDTWLDLALAHTAETLREMPRARSLIVEREVAIKGRLARLKNDDALRNWSGASGAAPLSYRWNPQVRKIVADIQAGLRAYA